MVTVRIERPVREDHIRIERGQQAGKLPACVAIRARLSIQLIGEVGLRAQQFRAAFSFRCPDQSCRGAISLPDAGLTSREIDDRYAVALVCKTRESPAASRLRIVRMSAHAHNVQPVRRDADAELPGKIVGKACLGAGDCQYASHYPYVYQQ